MILPKGSSLIAAASGYHSMILDNNATLNIYRQNNEAGSLSVKSNSSYGGMFTRSEKDTPLNIYGGTITSTGGGDSTNSAAGIYATDQTIAVYDGTLNAVSGSNDTHSNSGMFGNLKMYGGIFTGVGGGEGKGSFYAVNGTITLVNSNSAVYKGTKNDNTITYDTTTPRRNLHRQNRRLRR